MLREQGFDLVPVATKGDRSGMDLDALEAEVREGRRGSIARDSS